MSVYEFKKPKSLMAGITIFIYLILYVSLSYILGGKYTSAESIIKIILLCVVLFIICNQRNNIQSNDDKIISTFGIVFCLLQLVLVHNVEALRLMINLVGFYLLSRFAKRELIPYYSWGFKIAALLLVASAITLALRHGSLYFFRGETIMDKPFYTCLLGISSALCLIDVINRKNSILNALILITLSVVNVLMIQSKLSLFSIVVVGVIAFFTISKEERKRYRIFVYWALAVYLVFAFFFPDVVIPDAIKDGINRLSGYNMFYIETDATRLEGTYSIRATLWRYCMGLFYDHPFIGIGVGNFAEYNNQIGNIQWLKETESSLLAIICEGGFYYTLLMAFLFCSMIRRAYYRIKYNSEIGLIAMGVVVTYLVLIIGNDFLDSLFWISLGLMAGAMNSELQPRKRIRSTLQR